MLIIQLKYIYIARFIDKYTADDYTFIDLYIIASLLVVVVMVVISIFPNNYSIFNKQYIPVTQNINFTIEIHLYQLIYG